MKDSILFENTKESLTIVFAWYAVRGRHECQNYRGYNKENINHAVASFDRSYAERFFVLIHSLTAA